MLVLRTATAGGRAETLRLVRSPQPMVAVVVVLAMASLQRLSEVLVAVSVLKARRLPQQALMVVAVVVMAVLQPASML